MFTDFVINFDLKNDWVIAVWKFRLWITFQQFSTYIWQIDPKLKFSNGYNSVDIENCLASSKMQKHFKKISGNIFKKYLKISYFQKYFFSIIKNCQFSNIFFKIFPIFFLNIFAVLNLRGNSQCLLIFS